MQYLRSYPWCFTMNCQVFFSFTLIFIAPACSRMRHRCPLFHSSVRLSTFMSKFDIYVKVSILINYKTKQPSNLAWNFSLTSWLCDIGAHFSIPLSVRPSVCHMLTVLLCRSSTFMSVSILINYKTKQPSYLAWNISLTSWLCDIGARFSIRLFVRPPVCSSVNSSLMLKFDIYVKVSILINYNSTTTIIPCMTHLPDLLTWQVHWPSDLDLYFALHFDTVYVDVPDLLNYKVYNYQTLHSASPRCTDSAGTLTWWPWPIFCTPVTLTHFVSMFDISSTIRPTTIKPCKVLLLNVLTRQIPWPGDHDLYFGCSDFDIIYFNFPDLLKCKTSSHQTLHSASPRCTDPVTLTYILRSSAFYTFYVGIQYLLNYKAYNHQTLHSASPQCTDSTGTLTGWPWPIFRAPLTFTPFTSPFHMSSTVSPSTTKPYVVLFLDVLTRQVPWPGDLDLYFALQWLWHILHWCSISPQI